VSKYYLVLKMSDMTIFFSFLSQSYGMFISHVGHAKMHITN